jgi:hypothetical protein
VSHEPQPLERLARLETQMDHLLLLNAEQHADLKDHLRLARELQNAVETRLRGLEHDAERTETHLRWMKGIGLSIQALVLTWLGLK